MPQRRAVFKVVVGPNEGDVLNVEEGACRLIGRHLSENETVFMDRDGNRKLEPAASEMLSQGLRQANSKPSKKPGRKAEAEPQAPAAGGGYTRGPDIILADGAISRAHAMLFVDPQGVGIIDLASTNGTYVNNARTASRMLEDGDVIAIGSSEVAVSLRRS